MMSFRNENLQEKSIYEAILMRLARRSVRTYAPQPLARSTIKVLLEAAVRAPLAMHEEPWAFVVVQDKHLLKRLFDLAKLLSVEDKEAYRRNTQGADHPSGSFTKSDFDNFQGAGTLIITCAKTSGNFVAADCWLAAESMMLAACAIGLGSCVVDSPVAFLNTPLIKNEFGIPDEYSAIAPIVVGVPNGEDIPTPGRKPLLLAWK